MSRLHCLSLLLLLGACARSEDASVVVDTNAAQAVERVRAPEQDDREVAIGEWRATLQDEYRAIEFGPSGTAPLFSMRCDERRSLFLQRHGATPTGDVPMMLLTIGSETRRLAVTSAGGAVPMLRAALVASDPLVTTLARAQTPIIIRIGESLPLVMPPSPLIGQYVAQCGSGSSRDAGAQSNSAEAAAPANQAAPAPAPAEPAPARR
jgi:hypothetical protein